MMPHATKRRLQRQDAQQSWIEKRDAYNKMAKQIKYKNILNLVWAVSMAVCMHSLADYAKNESYSDLKHEIKAHDLTIRKLEACRYANSNRTAN